jgi:arylsulfatase A-like enzyme
MPRLLVSGLVLLSLLAPACRTPPRRLPNIVVIVVDTLRADALGCYGNPRPLTPFLDDMARGGIRFANAYAASSWTLPSVASLLSSSYPSQHGVTTLLSVMAEEQETLMRRLGRLGYRSAGFSANGAIGKAFAHAGFDSWVAYATFAHKVRGDTLARKSLQWVDRARASSPDRPLFLYYQFMEPHFPYEPRRPPVVASAMEEWRSIPAGWKGFHPGAKLATLETASAKLTPRDVEILKTLYERAVEDVDAAIRGLVADLRLRGILDDAIVVVTSDHGEEFREHGLMFHGSTLYEEQIRVPLVFVVPGMPAAVFEPRVSLVDVVPTLLQLIGVPPEPGFVGHPLLPLAPAAEAVRDTLAELPTPPYGDARHSEALIRGSIKMLVRMHESTLAGTEVYDLDVDPGETAPPDRRLWLRSVPLLAGLRSLQGTLSRTASPPATLPLSERTREHLRALGYIE